MYTHTYIRGPAVGVLVHILQHGAAACLPHRRRPELLDIKLYNTIQYNTIQDYTIHYYTILYCTILYYTVLYYRIVYQLCYTILSYIIS